MKKKHLRAINSVESYLSKNDILNEELMKSFQTIKEALNTLPDEEKKEALDTLPPPAEIAGEPNMIAVYSDGGCRGNPGPGAFAYVVQDHDGKVIAEGVEFEGHTTNNKMELSGPIRSLSELKDVLPGMGKEPLLTRVKIITDSKYVVDGMKSWVEGWKARGWKKADGKAPENLDLWQELDQIRTSFLNVEWMWVKGHGGHPQNEYCDRKANEAMDENLS